MQGGGSVMLWAFSWFYSCPVTPVRGQSIVSSYISSDWNKKLKLNNRWVFHETQKWTYFNFFHENHESLTFWFVINTLSHQYCWDCSLPIRTLSGPNMSALWTCSFEVLRGYNNVTSGPLIAFRSVSCCGLRHENIYPKSPLIWFLRKDHTWIFVPPPFMFY